MTEFTRTELADMEYILGVLLDNGTIYDDEDFDFTAIVAKARKMIEEIDAQ